MIEEADIKVGDEVCVVGSSGGPSGKPEEEHAGHVDRIGRTLVTITYGRGSHPVTAQFRKDTRAINDGYGHRRFETMQEAGERRRRERATTTLRERGVNLDWTFRHPLELVEALAAVVEGFKPWELKP